MSLPADGPEPLPETLAGGGARARELRLSLNLTRAEVAAHLASPRPPLLVDVREPEEFTSELGHIRGSLLVPLERMGLPQQAQ